MDANPTTLNNFDCVSAGTGPRWSRWIRSFNLYAEGKGIENPKQKRSLMLHLAGMAVQDIFFTLTLEEGESDEYMKSVNALTRYFSPQLNVPYERHLFRQISQNENETIDQFITRLRQKAESCEFGDKLNEQIRDQVIEKCNSSELRRRLLEKGTRLDLKELQDFARVLETANEQAQQIESTVPADNVNRVKTSYDRRKAVLPGREMRSKLKCYRCGRAGHISKDSSCPARTQECIKCGKIGHFAVCCKTKLARSKANMKVHHVAEDNGTKEHVFGLNFQDINDAGKVEIVVGGIPIRMIIDSGASCNVIDEELWKKLKKQKIECKSYLTNKKLYAYGKEDPLKVAGIFKASVTSQNRINLENEEFIVIEGKGQPLLGKSTAMKLQLLNFARSIEATDNNVIDLTEFEDIFNGIGKLKDFQLKIPIDKTVKPIAQRARRVPFNLREKLNKKIDELLNLDIIEKVDGPTPWVSPIVVVQKKGGEIRLCVDMRQANTAVIRERHPIPTMEEILQEMNQSCVFSKIDLKSAYHQIELAEESREITTFATNAGIYRFKRLLFGVSCAPEMYQKVVQQALSECEGVYNIFDDIIVHGVSASQHNERLRKLLFKIREKGLTLNREKCEFNLPQINFMGHVLSSKGIEPTDYRVKAIVNAREPENAKETRSFLGLVNYSGRFIQNLATISEPLRRLMRKDVKFEWGVDQKKAFDNLKNALANANTLAYYDKTAKTQVIADASPFGLGAVLVQEQNGENKVICYASRSLSDVERRYSQTEKEALALVWACERFHMYLYGAEFELLTDHRPLQFIYSPRSKPSARIERWVLRLQPYTYKVKYISGSNNIADSLSRLLQGETLDATSDTETEEYVRSIAKESTPVAMTTKELETASEQDVELSDVRSCIKNGAWHKLEHKMYLPVKSELCSIGFLILRGTRIVIPQNKREHILNLSHEGHPGIVGMKQRLRSKVWWPGIDKDVEKYCKQCYGCQLVSQPANPEPIKCTEMPTGPWQDIAIDLLGPMPSGESVLVVVDYFSRYYEIEIMRSTTAENIIEKLVKIFSTHGLPYSITSDNGPQFVSELYREFLKENGIVQRNVTPLWPQANGEVERQNRSLLKRMRIAHAEGKCWKKEIYAYLLMYRTTPHSTTGISPAELLFKRKLRTKLPQIDDYSLNDTEIIQVKDKDAEMKEKGKRYADEKRHAVDNDIKVGDKVLLKESYQNKLSTRFSPKIFHVIRKMGNCVVIDCDGLQYKRNVSHVKKFYERVCDDFLSNDDVNFPNNSAISHDVSTEANSQILDNCVHDTTRPVRNRKLPSKFSDYIVT